MMKFWIHNNTKAKSVKASQHMRKRLIKAGLVPDEQNPELVISIGGDGTLLSTFHKYEKQLDKVMFVALHTGHLGFYADWIDDEIDELVERIIEQQENVRTTSYPVIQVNVEDSKGNVSSYRAINEGIVRRLTSLTMKTQVNIDTEYFENFRGDGLCFATPTGSTAYAKAIGGALIHPKVDIFQMVEIASINNRVFRTISSPIIIPKDQRIDLYPEKADDYVVSCDGQPVEFSDIKKISVGLCEKRATFAQYRHVHFWSRVENAFLGKNEK
ncbi:NAD kinase [Companilactobacillus metriopterae]|uniref:NAD kinase n=1 Tax=Companilactobacillus metriopterae TaxID=1909267 RepID=UPI001F513151|nr:NAD kinase [Companilactobacillus metriopterae]